MKFAHNLLQALGREDLLEVAERPPGEGQQPLKDFLAETFAQRSQAEWVEWFRDQDVCFAPVRELAEVYADPFVTERQMLIRDEQGLEHIGIPIKYLNEPGQVHPRAPEHGEHSGAVLAELGYQAEEIEALRRDGVI